MDTLTYIGKIAIETCCWENCQIRFGMDSEFQKQRKEDHKGFYCPRGHNQYYSQKSDNEKLQDQIESLNRRIEYKDQTIQEKKNQIQQLNYSVRAQKAAKTKIMNRVKNGVCPCCNRTFKDLQNHFKTKHPELI